MFQVMVGRKLALGTDFTSLLLYVAFFGDVSFRRGETGVHSSRTAREEKRTGLVGFAVVSSHQIIAGLAFHKSAHDLSL